MEVPTDLNSNSDGTDSIRRELYTMLHRFPSSSLGFPRPRLNGVSINPTKHLGGSYTVECWISEIPCLACWEWWNLAVGIFSFAGGSVITRLFVGEKLNQLISFQEEEDRKKTKEAIAEFGWLKFLQEKKKKNEIEINIDMQTRIDDIRVKCEDYLNPEGGGLIVELEILRRTDRALSLIL